MGFHVTERVGLAGGVVARLRERILSGELAPGARLHQADLAERLGVSRIPVRDALHQLAAEGLVHLNGRAGATVTELSIADLQELYELREAIEPLASRLAAPNVGRLQVLRMGKWAEVMEAADSPQEWLAANRDFHAIVYEQSGRPRMIELIGYLRRHVDRFVRLHLILPANRERLNTEHRAILDAVAQRDPAAVEERTHAHLVSSHQAILAQLLDRQPPDDLGSAR